VTRARTEFHALLIVAFCATLGGRALAEPVRASLTVTRDDGSRECPDSAALTARVETVASRKLFEIAETEPRDTWVQVEFVRSISGFRAVISARGSRQGTRSLEDVGPECTSLADAVAITLAILLDPTIATGGDPPPLAVIPPAAPPVVAPASADSPTARPEALHEDTAVPTVIGLEGSAGPSFAMLEGVVPFVEAGVRGRFGDFIALGGGGGFVLPQRIDHGSGTVDVSLAYGYARGCANLLPKRRTNLEGCLEPMLGGLRGSGEDYDQGNQTEWVFWSAAAVLLQAYGPISKSMSWSIRARLLAPLVRHGFSVDNAGSTEEAFELSAVGGSLAFGFAAEL
jgi:hypothetical protein